MKRFISLCQRVSILRFTFNYSLQQSVFKNSNCVLSSIREIRLSHVPVLITRCMMRTMKWEFPLTFNSSMCHLISVVR